MGHIYCVDCTGATASSCMTAPHCTALHSSIPNYRVFRTNGIFGTEGGIPNEYGIPNEGGVPKVFYGMRWQDQSQ